MGKRRGKAAKNQTQQRNRNQPDPEFRRCHDLPAPY